jgi:endoribonuclease Dicer
VLDTGTGKTLIALLLIRHMAEQDAARKLKRATIVIAPSVPLVSQQCEFFQRNLSIVVRQYYGSKGVENVGTSKDRHG